VKLVVLGLSLSSSWGNGHATTYRALLRAFAARGHEVTFLEREAPWYARHRDLEEPEYCRLAFYRDPGELERTWRDEVAAADAAIVGSFVPDGVGSRLRPEASPPFTISTPRSRSASWRAATTSTSRRP
jgi:spore maturation protein CgeB